MRKANALILAGIGVALCHFELNFGGATHGVDHTDKLCQQSVACRFDNVTAVLAYLRVDQITEMGLQAFVRTLLVGFHQPRITRHIGS